MTTPHTIRSATADDTDRLVDIVTEAFLDDPVFNWFIRPDAKREEAIRAAAGSGFLVNDAVGQPPQWKSEQAFRGVNPRDQWHRRTTTIDGKGMQLGTTCGGIHLTRKRKISTIRRPRPTKILPRVRGQRRQGGARNIELPDVEVRPLGNRHGD